METPGLNVATNYVPDETVLVESYNSAIEHLRSRFSFLFDSASKEEMASWALSTWSTRTQRSYVKSHGNEQDISKLPAATKRNQKHKEKRAFKQAVSARPRKAKKKVA